MEKLVIGREAYDKIMYYVHKAKFEISGLGNVQIINGVPTVTDIILLKQENDPTETEIEADAITKALYDHHVSGMEGELKFWWHSHVDMGVFWSGTDKTTIWDLTKNGWFVHGVFNKKDEYKLAYSNYDEISKQKVFADDLKLEIDEDMIYIEENIEEQVKILEIEDTITRLYDSIGKIEDTVNKNIAAECDPKYDELVTDKVYVYKSNYNYYKGGQQTNSGKPLADVKSFKNRLEELATVKEIVPATSSTIFTGRETGTSYKELFDNKYIHNPVGALEFAGLGYTVKEIEYMQTNMNLDDIEDLMWHESVYGKITEDFDFIHSTAQ